MNTLINIYVGAMTTLQILSVLGRPNGGMHPINLAFHIGFIVCGFLILCR